MVNWKIVIIVVLILIVAGISIYFIATTKFPESEELPQNNFTVKLFDKDTEKGIDGQIFLVNEKLTYIIKKDFISAFNVSNVSNYTVFASAKGYYSEQINFLNNKNSLIEINLQKIGTIKFDQIGNITNDSIRLFLTAQNGNINNLGYCWGSSNNVINVHEMNEFDTCSQWLNYSFYDGNYNYSYYPSGEYRCPYSPSTVNQEDYRDKFTQCDYIEGIKCYHKSAEIPEVLKNKVIYCSNSIKNIEKNNTLDLNLIIKTSNPTDEDFIDLYFYDKDFKVINNQIVYTMGDLMQYRQIR